MNHPTRVGAVLATLAILGGCASENIRVRCGAHLQPINPPTVANETRTGRVPTPTASATSTAPSLSGDLP